MLKPSRNRPVALFVHGQQSDFHFLNRSNSLLCISAALLSVICFFFVFWPHPMAREILVPQPGIKSRPPASEASSLNHWTAREVLYSDFLTEQADLHVISTDVSGLHYPAMRVTALYPPNAWTPPFLGSRFFSFAAIVSVLKSDPCHLLVAIKPML